MTLLLLEALLSRGEINPILPDDSSCFLRSTFLAALMLLMGVVEGGMHDFSIFAIFLLVMVLNLLMMLFAHQVLKLVGIAPLSILGAVLGILQVALAIQMMLSALVMLHVIPPLN